MLFRLLNVKTFATHLFLFLIIVACAAKLDTPQTESIKHLKHYSGLSVPANRDYWTNSGVNVDVGDNLLVMASGTIIYWPKSKRKHPPSGTLMVKIGDSDQMQYKSKFYKTISTPGDLKFFVPDRYHNDNTGSFRIHVFVIAKGREIYLPDILYDFAAQNPGDEAFKTQLNQLYLANISDIKHKSTIELKQFWVNTISNSLRTDIVWELEKRGAIDTLLYFLSTFDKSHYKHAESYN